MLTWLERWHDLALSLVGNRWKRNNRFALAVEAFGGTTDEIYLTTETGVHTRSDGVGTYLTGKIDFDGRVDGGHLWVAGNNTDVVDVVDFEHF